MSGLLAVLALAAAWWLTWSWPSLAARWRRRRQVARLSSFVLDDLRSRVGGSVSWDGR